jgi:hypothetical protein
MKKFIASLITVLFLCGTAAQTQACYSAREFEAEQGIRIHSELMVIGLTCIKMPEGQELYRKYQDFTARNATLISGYESDLIGYYSSKGVSDPERKLHTLRTNLANEISRRAIAMSTLSFCQNFSSHLDKAVEMDQAKLRRWAQHVWPNQPPSEPVCAALSPG